MHFMTSLWPRIRPLLALVARLGRSLGGEHAAPAMPRPGGSRGPDSEPVSGPDLWRSALAPPALVAPQPPIERDGARGSIDPPAGDGRAARRRACVARRDHPDDRTPQRACGRATARRARSCLRATGPSDRRPGDTPS